MARDWRGSVVAAIPASGAAQINTYDAYGVPGAANQGRFQFMGQIWLAEVRLYHYKARLYDPWLGRFLQTEPCRAFSAFIRSPGSNDRFATGFKADRL